MFQYAYARALSEKGYHVYLDKARSYPFLEKGISFIERPYRLNQLSVTLKTLNVNECGLWKYIQGNNRAEILETKLNKLGLHPYRFLQQTGDPFLYDKKLCKVRNYDYIMGHFINEQYFSGIRNILLKEFSLKFPIPLSHNFEQALKNPRAVSVHIRRGDYLDKRYSKTSWLWNTVYYQKAFKFMNKKLETPIFYFFSDDLEWVRENINVLGEKHYINVDRKLTDVEEMSLMSRFPHHIIANSTFSWWGAWLAKNPEKLVIAPKMWAENFTPTDWIKL